MKPPLRILIVDDEPAILRTLSTCLNLSGFSCQTESRPKQALERLLGGEPVHILLTDVVMADLDGFALLRALRREGSLSQVVVMTAYSSLDRVLDAYRLGALDYLIKPFESLDHVVEVIRAAERRYRRWQNAVTRTIRKAPS